jgi:hypothetical protein
VVRTSEIHHLKVEILLSKVGRIPERDEEPNASERGSLGSGMILKKGAPPGRRSFLEIPMRLSVLA